MAEKAQTTVGGLRAVELYYRRIRDISSGSVKFYQSQCRLNTPQMGVLMPESFRDVCEVTTQCVELFRLELIQAMLAAKKFQERDLVFDWVSVYMPVKFLTEPGAEKKVYEIFERYKTDSNRICFSLGEKLLEEVDGMAADVIKKLRNSGYHFMVTNFGSNACPLMRLTDFAVDYVMLSPEITTYIGRDERSDGAVKAIIDFVSGLGAEPIADGVVNSTQAEKLFSFDCRCAAGTLSGKYMQERSVRRTSEEQESDEKSSS